MDNDAKGRSGLALRINLLMLTVILLSCGQKDRQTGNTGSELNRKNHEIELYRSKDALSDSLKLEFWNRIVIQFISKNKDVVIPLFKFPLSSKYSIIQEAISKPIEKITMNDFRKNYDKIFDDNFDRSLKEQSFKDIQLDNENDTLWYNLYINRPIGETEAGLYLRFIKVRQDYFLMGIEGIGADFYYKGD